MRLALGLERSGLFALERPIRSCIVLAVLCVVAFLGAERIKVDDSLSQLFRSDTLEFKQYEEVTKRFPSGEKARHLMAAVCPPKRRIS